MRDAPQLQRIEYIVVHEMAHLLERRHNDRFTALMNEYLPQWRHLRSIAERRAARARILELLTPRSRSPVLDRSVSP